MRKLNELTDERLVQSYIEGNNCAFDVLLKRYESKIFTYITYSVHNQEVAEDLFQDAFLRIITTLRSKRYTENGKFSQWAMRIVHNLIIDYYRQCKGDNTISNDSSDFDLLNDASLVTEENIEKQMIDKQTLKEVKELIRMLPDNQKEIVLMRFYKELSFKEIAEKTGVSINTALGRMRYALINLRKMAENNDVNLAC
ncbi:MAG: sigma-70 family RNA polymerase sigma factor [Bacteroidaceae bacterium]|nr:sigma-70 family RNA polymerase sigma factor [Bacteroidaceae bacterium]